jgi:hypothetical protein
MSGPWIQEEVEEAWTLGPDEHLLLSGKRAGYTCLGFAVLVRFFAREGRFPDPSEVDREEGMRGLTPLLYGHVNPYGRFELDMSKRLPLSDNEHSM